MNKASHVLYFVIHYISLGDGVVMQIMFVVLPRMFE